MSLVEPAEAVSADREGELSGRPNWPAIDVTRAGCGRHGRECRHRWQQGGFESCLEAGVVGPVGGFAFAALLAAVDRQQIGLPDAPGDLALRIAESVAGVAVAGVHDDLLEELDLAGGAGEILGPEARPVVVGDHAERVHDLAVEPLGEVVFGEIG